MGALKNTSPRMNIHVWMTLYLDTQHRLTLSYKQCNYSEPKDVSLLKLLEHRSTQKHCPFSTRWPKLHYSSRLQFQALPHDVWSPRLSFLINKRPSDSETLPAHSTSTDQERRKASTSPPWPLPKIRNRSFLISSWNCISQHLFILSVKPMYRVYGEYTLF